MSLPIRTKAAFFQVAEVFQGIVQFLVLGGK